MCGSAVTTFFGLLVQPDEVKGKSVLEVGSFDVNGSLRGLVQEMEPASYLGVDIEAGPGVDEVCDVSELVVRYGKDAFDAVICTEVLEHVRDWRAAVSNLKNVVKPGGMLFFSTRSKGFPYHGYPHDFWRYEKDDLSVIFADFGDLEMRWDFHTPGVLLKANKPKDFSECDVSEHKLYSIVSGKPRKNTGALDLARFSAVRVMAVGVSRLLPAKLRAAVSQKMPKASARFVGYEKD